MAFVKLVKNNAYYKRYQTKYRRRREGKTDYYARKRLIVQDKDKYNSPKYRLVVRRTNKKIICQIIYATLKGDEVKCQALSSELVKYGLTAGLTNYSSAYATGLLLARRLLNKLGMDKDYVGVEKVTAESYNVEEKEDCKRPFKAVLDVGLIHTTTGNRIFGALKGAIDGGIQIPHSEKRFPGYTRGEEKGDSSYDANVHRERILGVHVDKYMAELKEEGAEDYKKQFAKWDECLQKSGCASVEALYTKVHAAIRKDPAHTKKAKKEVKAEDRKWPRQIRLTLKQRKKNVAIKIKKMAGGKKW